jgi:hypothetical protein
MTSMTSDGERATARRWWEEIRSQLEILRMRREDRTNRAPEDLRALAANTQARLEAGGAALAVSVAGVVSIWALGLQPDVRWKPSGGV